MVAACAVLFPLGLDESGLAWAGEKSGSSSRSGTLGQVTTAVRNETSSPARPPSDGGSSGGGSYVVDNDDYYDRGYDPLGYSGCSTCGPVIMTTPGMRTPRAGGPVPKTTVELEAGLQSVEGSDASISGAVRVSKGDLGLFFEGRRYLERGDAMDESGLIHMDVWALAVAGRIVRLGGAEMWVHGGVSGTGSNEFDSLKGPMFGATMRTPVTSSMALRGGASYYLLEQGMRAVEAQAELSVSVLAVGYRMFRFDVGPTLHGPEMGVRVRF
ncbi:hypothetical protein [Haliangium sp.]|uniref:hypothetical protein n=1 Tax=Haliangium sp. TaxID=2663208 RepID=UPI003D10C1F8